MSHVADERLLHAVFSGSAQKAVQLLRLIVRHHARQNGDDLCALRRKRLDALRRFAKRLCRNIEIVRLERGQLRRHLLGGKYLIDACGIRVVIFPLRQGRYRQAPAFRQRGARLLQPRDEAAAQVVDRARREIEIGVDAALGSGAVIRGAPRLGKLLGKALLAHGGALGALRHGAGQHGAVLFGVLHGGHDRLALPRHDVKLHGHAANFALGVSLAGGGEHLFRRAVVLRAGAEHVRSLLPQQIALREALTGKGQLQLFLLRRGGRAPLADAPGVHIRHHGDVFGALHAPFDLRAGDARVLELAEIIHKAVVPQAEGILVHASAHAVLHAARLRARAAVAAAPADQRAHVALAGIAEAQRAVHEHLRLDARVFGNRANLVERKLPRQHRAGEAHFGGGLHAREVVNAHLRARVQRNVRHGVAQHAHQAEILHDNRIRAVVRRLARQIGSGCHLPVAHEGVERDIDLAAADVAVAHRLGKLILCEIVRAAARVVRAKAHVNRVGAVLHRGNHGVRRSGGR